MTAEHWRCRGAVSCHLEDARLRHETAAHAVLGQIDAAKLCAGHTLNPIKLREAPVKKSEIGIDQVFRRVISAHELRDEKSCFLERSLFEWIVEFVVVIERGRWRGVVDLAQIEPVVG